MMIIEKNIPFPVNKKCVTRAYAKWRQMEVGDSILFEKRSSANNVAIKLRMAAMQGAYREVEGGFRVWRMA